MSTVWDYNWAHMAYIYIYIGVVLILSVLLFSLLSVFVSDDCTSVKKMRVDSL